MFWHVSYILSLGAVVGRLLYPLFVCVCLDFLQLTHFLTACVSSFCFSSSQACKQLLSPSKNESTRGCVEHHSGML